MDNITGQVRLVARAGEWVTCVGGHRICEVARDLVCGDPIRRDDFKNFTQPEQLSQIQPCTICGCPWTLTNFATGGSRLCVEKQWRPRPIDPTKSPIATQAPLKTWLDVFSELGK